MATNTEDVDVGPLKGFINAVNDRLSGLPGTYALFCILWNWRVVIHLLYGNSSASERINSIRDLYSPSFLDAIGEIYLWPFIITGLYLVAVPLLRDFYSKSITERIRRNEQLRELRANVEYEQIRHYDKDAIAIIGHLLSVVHVQRHEMIEAYGFLFEKKRHGESLTESDIEGLCGKLKRDTDNADKVIEDYRPLLSEHLVGDIKLLVPRLSRAIDKLGIRKKIITKIT